ILLVVPRAASRFGQEPAGDGESVGRTPRCVGESIEILGDRRPESSQADALRRSRTGSQQDDGKEDDRQQGAERLQHGRSPNRSSNLAAGRGHAAGKWTISGEAYKGSGKMVKRFRDRIVSSPRQRAFGS